MDEVLTFIEVLKGKSKIGPKISIFRVNFRLGFIFAKVINVDGTEV